MMGFDSLRRVAAAGALIVAGCTVADPPVIECPTPEVVLSPPRSAPDACSFGTIVHQQVVAREAGAPVEGSSSFTLERDGSLCIVITSPASSADLPSAAADVAIDGAPLTSERGFSHHRTRVEVRVSGSAGEHTLTVRARSSPRSTIRIEVRYAPAYGEPERAQAVAVADLESRSCAELNRMLEAAGPAHTERVLRGYGALGLVPGRLVFDTNAHGVPALLTPSPWRRYP